MVHLGKLNNFIYKAINLKKTESVERVTYFQNEEKNIQSFSDIFLFKTKT